MDDAQKNRLREYAWNYFAFHAEQRLKTFHLYLILVAVIIAGFITALNYTEDHSWLSVFGFLLMFLSILFGRLDIRNKQLVRNGEEALKYLDEQESLKNNRDEPHILKIFAHDDYMLARTVNDQLFRTRVTYSKFLTLLFWGLAFLGLGAGIACLLV
jgi:hypothetical protein